MKKIIILTGLIILSGCAEKPEPVQTVNWYKTNNAERKIMLAKCNNNSGELMLTANCINAKKASNNKDNARRGWTQPDPVKFN